MAEKSTRISNSSSGSYLATRDAFELDDGAHSRVIPRVDFSAGKFLNPIDAPYRGNMARISAADSFDLTALPSELLNSMIMVGDGSILTVAVEQVTSLGTLTITPILFDDAYPPNVVGVLSPKLFTQPYTHRRGSTWGDYPLSVLSWDVSGAHKIGLHCSAISGTSNTCRVYAWIDGVVPDYDDANYREVTLLLPMSGDDEAQATLDYSKNNHAVTFVGNAKIDTTQSKYGGSALYLDGNGDYLTVAHSSVLAINTHDFTIECWIYIPTMSQLGNIICKDGKAGTDIPSYYIQHNTSGQITIGIGDGVGAAGFTYATSGRTLSTATWYHVAFVRYKNLAALFIDGELWARFVIKYTGDGGRNLYIGYQQDQASTNYFLGCIEDLRITKGKTRYWVDFPPELETGAYTADDALHSYTSLLLHMEGTDDAQVFTDDSPNGFTVTANGGVKTENTQAKFGSTSGYFDGTGDYLTVPDDADFNLTSGDFWIEVWVYPTAAANGVIICKDGKAGVSYPQYNIYFQSSGSKIVFETGSGNGTSSLQTLTSTAGISLNEWSHIACGRLGDRLFIIINGVLDTFTAQTSTMTSGGRNLHIGYQESQPSGYFTGYMDELRIVKGRIKTGAAFTPPTASLPLIELPNDDPHYWRTKLLVHGEGANNSTTFKDSSASPKTLTPSGGAKISTAQYKHGSSSIYLDGDADYIQIGSGADSDFDLSTGDFTIEAWCYPASADYGVVIGRRTTSGGYCFDVRTGIVYFYFWDSGGTYREGIAVADLTLGDGWHHVAITRKGDVHSLWIDGVYAGGNTTSYRPSTTALTAYIGYSGYATEPYYYSGYLTDIRFTKGVARYTDTFTPPTTMLPSIRER